jgi:pyruvate carboxylase
MGQPVGGFPQELQKLVLKGIEPITCRPGELLEAVDFDEIGRYLEQKHGFKPNRRALLSYALYPKVFEEFIEFRKQYGDLSRMNSPVFFNGIGEGEVCEVEVDEGKTFIIKLVAIGKIDKEGYRKIDFEVNGNQRAITVLDKSYQKGEVVSATMLADPDNKNEIGASIPGTVAKIMVKEGDKVKAGQNLILLEAMKMETQIIAPVSGEVTFVNVTEGKQVKNGELLLKIE